MRNFVIRDIKRKTSVPRATIRKAVEKVMGVTLETKSVVKKAPLRKAA